MLLTVTPDTGANIVLPDPISTRVYLYPIGISTEEFNGMVRVIGEEVLRIIVLLTSARSNTKLEVFVITVDKFTICGSTSNLLSTEFQSSPVPTRSD